MRHVIMGALAAVGLLASGCQERQAQQQPVAAKEQQAVGTQAGLQERENLPQNAQAGMQQQAGLQQQGAQAGLQQQNAQSGLQQQGGQSGLQQQGGQAGAQAQAGAQGEAALQGQLQGLVRDVAWEEGVVKLDTGNNLVTLQGTPGQVRSMRQGEQAQLSYVKYGDELWIVGPQQPSNVANVARQATQTGVINKLDKNEGTLTLSSASDNLTFRAHPQMVEQLVPGQFISLTYQNVGDTNWVSNVQPATQGGGATGGQQNQGGNR
jgi:hypothetical protein